MADLYKWVELHKDPNKNLDLVDLNMFYVTLDYGWQKQISQKSSVATYKKKFAFQMHVGGSELNKGGHLDVEERKEEAVDTEKTRRFVMRREKSKQNVKRNDASVAIDTVSVDHLSSLWAFH